MSERYIYENDDEYVYFIDTESEDYKTLEDFEKAEFEDAKKDNIDIEEYEDAILQTATGKYWDYIYNNHIEADTVCDILNKQDAKISEQAIHLDFLKAENMHMNEVLQENRQLKQTIQEVTELLTEEVDLFTDKAIEHDIIAYTELKEFDNKDAYYMATATKKAIQTLKEAI